MKMDGKITLRNKQTTPFYMSSKSAQIKASNFNPVFSISSLDHLSTPLFKSPQTVFTVAQTDNALEQILWHLHPNDSTHFIMTNYRLADLRSDVYINLEDHHSIKPFLATFVMEKSPDHSSESNAVLHLGNTTRADIPAAAMTGSFGDIILYDRILTHNEQCRVESMLAIKYGIHKSSFYSPHYLSADGSIIFDGWRWSDYAHDIAGIGRDDQSDLYQPRSMSTQTDLPLTISVNEVLNSESNQDEVLLDGTFLMWGHDDSPFNPKESDQIVIPFHRKYMVQLTNWNSETKTDLELNLEKNQIYLSPNEYMYLGIDENMDQDFHPQHRHFYRADLHDAKAIFSNVNWDTDSSGTDVFTFFIAPENFIYAKVVSGDCALNQKPLVTWNIVGAQPPFSLSISNKKGDIMQFNAPTHTGELKLPDHGIYRMSVIDANGHQLEHSIIVNPDQMINEAIPKGLTISNTGGQTFDPAQYGIHDYIWYLPNGEQLIGQPLELIDAGKYYLLEQSGSCDFVHTITVEQINPENHIQFTVFPNPTINGRFNLNVRLEESEDLIVRLLNIQGQVLSTKNYNGRTHYLIQDRIDGGKGSYILNLKAGGREQSVKLISQ
jgi:hypothetical protein